MELQCGSIVLWCVVVPSQTPHDTINAAVTPHAVQGSAVQCPLWRSPNRRRTRRQRPTATRSKTSLAWLGFGAWPLLLGLCSQAAFLKTPALDAAGITVSSVLGRQVLENSRAFLLERGSLVFFVSTGFVCSSAHSFSVNFVITNLYARVSQLLLSLRAQSIKRVAWIS